MKKFTKSLFLLLSFMLVIGISVPSFAVDYDIIKNEERTVQEFIVPTDIELIQDEDGNFSGKFEVKDERAAHSAKVEYNLYQDANYDNLYEIFYNIKSNTLIDQFKANIKVTNTSLLNPEAYFDEDINDYFGSTSLYHGSAGMVVIPSDVKKVKLKAQNTKIYFIYDGWVSGVNFDGTYNVN